jgi:hypothetical protein
MRSPSFDRGTVVSVSTMSRLDSCNPLISLGSTGSRIKGASVVSLVNVQIVTDPVPWAPRSGSAASPAREAACDGCGQ